MTSDQRRDQPELRAALAAVEAQLVAAEREQAALAARLVNLQSAASGLRGLLGMDRQEFARDARSENSRLLALRLREREVEGRRRDREAGQSADVRGIGGSTGRQLEDPAAGESEDEDRSSTDRVVELLAEFRGRAITRQVILHEFARRGWVDPSWKEPEAAMRMAIRRAVERGDVAAVLGGRYVLRAPELFHADPPEGGDSPTSRHPRT